MIGLSKEPSWESGKKSPIQVSNNRSLSCGVLLKNGQFLLDDCSKNITILCEKETTNTDDCLNIDKLSSDDYFETNWLNGREKCRSIKGTMIEILTEKNKDIIQDYMKKNSLSSIWIGYTNIEWTYINTSLPFESNSSICVSYNLNDKVYNINANTANNICQNDSISDKGIPKVIFNDKINICSPETSTPKPNNDKSKNNDNDDDRVDIPSVFPTLSYVLLGVLFLFFFLVPFILLSLTVKEKDINQDYQLNTTSRSNKYQIN
ncbi:DgyrCDS12761 [Dimorphilus gyrociliatus]|uniref:DgyrCDS12761 n=1 Tax=Dimorphilus gyrociliatus TaxID=2664684 RepID=A0A7I8W7G7_9ANNE|nr:DgyrCDS12761 [Dimorphilus gyrociliatus]